MAKKLISKAFTYLLGTGLNSAIPFLLLPIFTRYLSPSDMGRVAMYQSALAIIVVAIVLYTPTSTSARFFRSGKENLAEYIGTGTILSSCIALALAAALGFSQSLIERYTGLSYETTLLAIGAAFLQLFINIKLKLFQMEGRATGYSALQNLNTLLIMLLSIALVVPFSLGWLGRVWGQFLATTLTASVVFFLMLKRDELRIRWNKHYAREILEYGLPLIPHGIGTLAAIFINRTFLINMTDLAEVGYYMVATQLTSIITICATALNQAYAPWLYKKLSLGNLSPRERLRIVKGTYLQFSIMLCGAFLFSVCSPFFISIFLDSSYTGVIKYIPFLATACAFNGMYFMVTNYLFFHKKTGRLGSLSASLALLAILLTPICIRTFGPIGVALATLISNIFLFFVTWFMSMKVEQMPWSLFLRNSSR